MQSHGSARVRFAEGGTDVITSVRVETANYSEVMDPRDQIDVSLVFTASSSPSFLTRERSVEGELIAESIRKLVSLLSLTDRVLTSPGVMDLDELIIVKGLFCWKIDIDIQVYGDSGNVFDLAMLSVAAALRVTRIPCTVPVKNYEQEEKDFEIDDDATHFRRLSCMAVPISISICKVCRLRCVMTVGGQVHHRGCFQGGAVLLGLVDLRLRESKEGDRECPEPAGESGQRHPAWLSAGCE